MTLKPIQYTVMFFVCAAVTSVVNAADYKPVKCDQPLAYEGPALHPALPSETLEISGSLAGELPAPLVARLETAMKQAMSLTHAPVMTAAIAVPGQGSWNATLKADGSVSAQKRIGHSGGTPGAKAVVAYSLADKAFVAVALNTDGSAEATANLLLKQLGDGSSRSE